MSPGRVTLLRRDVQRVVPWRNGGGSTREVAVEPAAEAPTGFRWRVSIARVETDGPFSSFPGVDRTLWLLSGAGLELVIDGATTRLAEPFASVAFDGGAVASARLLGGPTDDLNLMVDRARGRAAATVQRLAPGVAWTWMPHDTGTDLILVLAGSVDVHSAATAGVRLDEGDAARIDGAQGRRAWTLQASAPTVVFVATLL